jgi:glyceraldehyde 3-phosphate dehydrogenase
LTTINRPVPDDFFKDWKEREALAESMIPVIGKLHRDNNVACYIYGRNLMNRSVIDIMKAHRFVRQVERNELSEFETYPVLEELAKLNLGPSHIDVGRIAAQYMNDDHGMSLADYVRQEVGEAADNPSDPLPKPQHVVLYGFGRIGRLMCRLMAEKSGGGQALRLRAVVVRSSKDPVKDLIKRASLLRRDSIHGGFKGTIRVLEEESQLVVNGNVIQFIYANSPSDIDYTQYGIHDAIVVDNTGAWRDESGLSQHLEAKGVAKVLLTAPGKGGIKNIVSGINHGLIDPENDKIISAASCTTNAIVPALKLINDEYGVERGHVETVHAYTNDQNLTDNFHSAERRGRSAAMNMVLTETGAAKAVAVALPELAGKLTGNAIRVPTPNVSMAILNLTLTNAVERDALNEFMRNAALRSPLLKQIEYTDSPEVVSSDFIGSRTACIYDAKATITNGNSAVIYLWYDNEFGYTCQVHRVLEKFAGVDYATYPKKA